MIALALALCLQNVDGLSSDDPEVREATSKKLIQLGPAALVALKKLDDHPDAEVRARARQIVAEIGRRRRMKAMRPAPRLTLELKGADVHEAARKVFGAFGVESRVLTRDPVPVTLSLKEATLWQACDAFRTAIKAGFWTCDGSGFMFWPDSGDKAGWERFHDAGDVRIVARPAMYGTGDEHHGDMIVHVRAWFLRARGCCVRALRTRPFMTRLPGNWPRGRWLWTALNAAVDG